MDGASRSNNVSRLCDLGSGIAYHEQILICFERRFVLNHAVLGNPNADKSRANCAQSANNRGAFQCAYPIQATRGPATSKGPMPGIAKKADPNNIPHKPPQKAPVLPQYFIRSPVL